MTHLRLSPNTKKLIGIIKAAQQYLQIDDDTYRHILMRLTGKRSATKLTLQELETVREYFHEQGYPRKVAKKHGRKPNVSKTKKMVLSKIEALLTDAGRPWTYAEAMAKRMFRRQALEWLTLDELSDLMKALIIDAKRREKNGSQSR
ncbi:gp16 family protein [Proteus mirabilis]|uniref:gp16 family protein n=1 Tax=Proteus mirabilis TaxID=584 RepID=UPI003F1939B4